MNPGDRPRRIVLGALAAVAAGAVIALPIVADPDVAAADELQPFGSCEELAAWGAASPPRGGADTDTAVAESGAAQDAAASPRVMADESAAGTATGETNVIVEGVDELDTVDRVDGAHLLVIAGGTLALVDPVAGTVVATTPAPQDARLTFDPEADLAWVVGTAAEGGTSVSRVAVEGSTLRPSGTWTTSGWLVDARRTGDRLHVVAVEGFAVPTPGGVPFEDGPVACDEVLHPAGPSNPEATLLVSLPSSGDLEPIQAAEVVGAGQLVHVTSTAAYLATPLWDEQTSATSIHRFDLETLAHTGSGRVEGTLLNPFSMSEHAGHLRVAVTHGGGPVTLEDAAVDVAVDRSRPAVNDPSELLNEIVVLDLDGDLDVVGRTPRFGHPGETLHGIRFVGEVAYAVTFLNTDPFYVVDVADPAAPQVVGEVELPGFSAYLHPIGEDLVVGFGPDGEGRVGAKLFDVADPTAPRVVDAEPLGDDSPVVWDHHALTPLDGGRFALPATSYRPVEPAGCTADGTAARNAEIRALEARLADLEGDDGATEPLLEQLEALYADPCVSPTFVTETEVVVAGVAGGAIDVESRFAVAAPEAGSRVLPAGDGWAVLAGTHLVVLDADGAVRHDLELA